MMLWVLAVFLIITMIGLPLCIAPAGTTAALAAVAGLLVSVGLWTRVSGLLTAGVAVGLMEALVAMLLAATPPDLWLALLLGVAIYLLLDVGAFMTNFCGVVVDAGVYRMKAIYWGWTAVLLALVGLVVGMLAVALAQSWTAPLLLYVLAVVSAGIVIGIVVGVVHLWQQ
jgi:hypothetical protein